MANECVIMLMIFSWFFVGLCQGQGGGGQPPCMKDLFPCLAYLRQPSPNPPASCCVPLKMLVSTDGKCLCDVFNNPAIMASMNATQANAMNLVKGCGSNLDASLCKNTASTPTVSPSNSSSNSNSSSPSSNTNSTAGGASNTNFTAGGAPPNSAASHVSKFGGSSILLVLYVFIFNV